jgi:hypothetical protein
MLDSQKYDYISADIETRILISEFCSAKQLTLHIIDPYKPYNCVALTSDRVVSETGCALRLYGGSFLESGFWGLGRGELIIIQELKMWRFSMLSSIPSSTTGMPLPPCRIAGALCPPRPVPGAPGVWHVRDTWPRRTVLKVMQIREF